ncbi:hypothetical protein VSDG_08188 [Cytospora chrysosperma]|uniref:Uncharacterized protein n=1 Tax=Cytospora chrysosperma TaxID=252740 RepID=A0A423VGY2_CYTCH|nr:hypothetical protein VSDG_08188 [Valsa sordida]
MSKQVPVTGDESGDLTVQREKTLLFPGPRHRKYLKLVPSETNKIERLHDDMTCPRISNLAGEGF